MPEYRALRRELERLAGHINGRYAEPDWTPMRYVNRDYPPRRWPASTAWRGVGLVTPLRDGMNLVAKEFVAAQDPEDPGVLVLSRFAGAAARDARQRLHRESLRPRRRRRCARARARMPLDERKERWHALHKRLQQHDITLWRRKFLEALAA